MKKSKKKPKLSPRKAQVKKMVPPERFLRLKRSAARRPAWTVKWPGLWRGWVVKWLGWRGWPAVRMRLPSWPDWRRMVLFLGVATVFVGCATVLAVNVPAPETGDVSPNNAHYPAELRREYASLVESLHAFEDRQAKSGQRIVSDRELQQMLSRVQIDAASGHFREAKADITLLQTAVGNWNLELNGGTGAGRSAERSTERSVERAGGIFLPILLYHYTPPDFEQQLEHLSQHGYTVIDLDEALAGMRGGPLPEKPVVITFDDGFENQMQAFEILKRHNMKATYYIIAGGERSRWCIGAGRRYGDPLQPPGGCGDAYLTWDQVRELDRSGLVTIGGHTIDHENLVYLTADEQRMEISGGKATVEQELGHPIKHFAYPYGSYNAETVLIVRNAGFVTAVTTLPGSYQTAGSELTMKRLRDAYSLP